MRALGPRPDTREATTCSTITTSAGQGVAGGSPRQKSGGSGGSRESPPDLEAQGYERVELTVGLPQANIFALALAVPLCVGATFAFMLLHPDVTLLFDLRPPQFAADLAILFALVVTHELIHGVTWGCFARGGLRDVEFGFLFFQYEQLPTSILKRILNTIAVILSATYIAYFISGPDPLVVIYRMNRLFQEFEKIAPQLATIILLIALSKFLQDFELLRKVGGDSLYLCGNEAIGKDMLIEFCTLFFSASFNIYTIIPVQLFLFTLFCLFVIDYTLVRISKPLIAKVQNYVQAKCQVLFKVNM